MTTLENDDCKVVITIDDTVDDAYASDADFVSRYDIVLDPYVYPRGAGCKAYAIHVIWKDRQYTAALIGDGHCFDRNCAVIEGDVLTILQGWEVTQFNVTAAQIIRTVAIDTPAPNFEIHKVGRGYLIHGEMDITMLNDKLEKVWSFSGRDIFVSPSGKRELAIKSDRICLYDWEDNYYEVDLNGNMIRLVENGNNR